MQVQQQRFLEAWQTLERGNSRMLLDELANQQLQLLNDADRKKREEFIERLAEFNDRIRIASSSEVNAEQQKEIDEIARQRSIMQREFDRFESDVFERNGVAVSKPYSLERIQANLSKNSAILMWLDVNSIDKSKDVPEQHWACVIRSMGEPIWVRLTGTGEKRELGRPRIMRCWKTPRPSVGDVRRMPPILSGSQLSKTYTDSD